MKIVHTWKKVFQTRRGFLRTTSIGALGLQAGLAFSHSTWAGAPRQQDSADPTDEGRTASDATVLVGTIAELQRALNAIAGGGPSDITITASIRRDGDPVHWPAAPSVTLRAINGAVLQHDGSENEFLIGAGAPSRAVYFRNVIFDGGWQTNQSEASLSSVNTPLSFNHYGVLECHGCTFRNMRLVGICATDIGRALYDGCTFLNICRDGTWANNTVEFTASNCTFRATRDDAGSCHVDGGRSIPNRKVRFINNVLFQGYEVKFLGGGDVLIENNVMDLMGPAGIYLGVDPSTGEGSGQIQTGYVVTNNTIRNVMNTGHPDLGWSGDIQTAIMLYCPGVPAGITISGNTLVHLDETGRRVRDVYPAETQIFDKGGFIDPVIPAARAAIRIISSNANDPLAVYIHDNVYVGNWDPATVPAERRA